MGWQPGLGTITPTLDISSSSTASYTVYTYTPYQTANFSIATTGAYTVTFQGMGSASGDSTAFVTAATISVGCAIADGSFEEPALAFRTYAAQPTGTSWTFTGDTGVSNNSSGFTFGNPVAPDGDQVAYLEGTGTISQSVYLVPGTYDLTFMAAQRNKYQSSYQSFAVTLNGQTVGTVTPSSPSNPNATYPPGTKYGLYASNNFTVSAAGYYTIGFVGLNPNGGDNTAFIDDVQLNA